MFHGSRFMVNGSLLRVKVGSGMINDNNEYGDG